MLHPPSGEPAFSGSDLRLPPPLSQRLRQLALRRGCGFEALGVELLEQALEQAEALPAGRCSTRMGQSSAGPVPLPVQQA
jgi:hypothetical protein